MTQHWTPGSDEALKKGCRCPILDNAHGKGYLGQPGVFVYVENCPLHRHEIALAEIRAEKDRKRKGWA